MKKHKMRHEFIAALREAGIETAWVGNSEKTAAPVLPERASVDAVAAAFEKACKASAKLTRGSDAAIALSDQQLMTMAEVCTLLAVGKSTIYNWLQSDEVGFPKPFHLMTGLVRFKAAEVRAFIEKCEQDGKATRVPPKGLK